MNFSQLPNEEFALSRVQIMKHCTWMILLLIKNIVTNKYLFQLSTRSLLPSTTSQHAVWVFDSLSPRSRLNFDLARISILYFKTFVLKQPCLWKSILSVKNKHFVLTGNITTCCPAALMSFCKRTKQKHTVASVMHKLIH